MSTGLQVAPLSGDELADALPDLARLRIDVFRAFPYLYDGSLDYEAKYLSAFAAAKDAVIIAARDEGRVVGCATGSSFDGHHDAFAEPLRQAGVDPATTFYCGESVLLGSHRGRGLGHAFFDLREAHARARGYRRACFCAVVRNTDHPARPADYSPLDRFWTQRGYRKLPDTFARFSWKDVGENAETEKLMQVWLREFAD